MEDKDLMEGVLLLEKGVCDLYLHGTIESSTSQVHQTFLYAGYPVRSDGSKGMVSHRPC